MEKIEEIKEKIAEAIEKGITTPNGKWDEVVCIIKTENLVYGVSMTDPDKSEFPEGCILVSVMNIVDFESAIKNNEEMSFCGPLGDEMIDYNYGDIEDITDWVIQKIYESVFMDSFEKIGIKNF